MTIFPSRRRRWDLDLEVEGIVDRIAGLSRRIHPSMDETLAEFGLDSAEHKALSTLAQAGRPIAAHPGSSPSAWISRAAR
jgi:hypothetical protein